MVAESVLVCRSSVVGAGLQSFVGEGAKRESAGPGRSVFLGAQVQKMGAGMSARSDVRPAAVPKASGGMWTIRAPFLLWWMSSRWCCIAVRHGSSKFFV